MGGTQFSEEEAGIYPQEPLPLQQACFQGGNS